MAMSLKHYVVIEEENTCLNNSNPSAREMEFNNSIQLGICLNKMELLRGRTEPSWRWPCACSKQRTYRTSTGE